MESSRIISDKPGFGEVLNRVIQFIVCGLIEMGVYIVIMLPLFSLARGMFENDESALNALPPFFFEILFALLYILPLRVDSTRQLRIPSKDKPSCNAQHRGKREDGCHIMVLFHIAHLRDSFPQRQAVYLIDTIVTPVSPSS